MPTTLSSYMWHLCHIITTIVGLLCSSSALLRNTTVLKKPRWLDSSSILQVSVLLNRDACAEFIFQLRFGIRVDLIKQRFGSEWCRAHTRTSSKRPYIHKTVLLDACLPASAAAVTDHEPDWYQEDTNDNDDPADRLGPRWIDVFVGEQRWRCVLCRHKHGYRLKTQIFYVTAHYSLIHA